MAIIQARVLLIFALAVLSFGTGCASRRGETVEPIHRGEPVAERPARPLEEEETLSDRIGEAGVAVLVVTIILGAIALPIILLM